MLRIRQGIFVIQGVPVCLLPKGAPSPYTQRGNLQLCSQSRSLLICFEAVVARVWRSVKASLLAILHRCGLEPGVYLSSGPNSSATTAATILILIRYTAWFFLSFCVCMTVCMFCARRVCYERNNFSSGGFAPA